MIHVGFHGYVQNMRRIKFYLLDFGQIFTKILDLLKGFESTLGANKRWGGWSDMVMFPDIPSHESTFQSTLLVRVLEWLASLAGCKMYGMTGFEAWESRKSLIGWCSL